MLKEGGIKISDENWGVLVLIVLQITSSHIYNEWSYVHCMAFSLIGPDSECIENVMH